MDQRYKGYTVETGGLLVWVFPPLLLQDENKLKRRGIMNMGFMYLIAQN